MISHVIVFFNKPMPQYGANVKRFDNVVGIITSPSLTTIHLFDNAVAVLKNEDINHTMTMIKGE